jgi:predicted TIM-barrel fold metal-dependent hydrolase
MDFAHFADVPVIDAHIHCKHQDRMDRIVMVMERVPYARVNLLSMPDREQINHNPAVIRFKSCYPDRGYISGGLDYVQAFADPKRVSQNLASQIETLQAIGFDGLKMYASSPRSRKWLKIPVDAPEYAGAWAKLEELDMPVLSHVAEPEEYWDMERIPAYPRERGWFLGDGSFPLKEEFYAEMDGVLERHPGLKLILAHFNFLSADLARAGDFFDAHPNVCFDLTPDPGMCNRFALDPVAARDFFIRYQDQLIYGTDITSAELEPGDQWGMTKSLGKAWVVRSMLESDEEFQPTKELHYWLYPGTGSFRGLALPREVLEKIYRTNFERLYGAVPAPLDREKAVAELERMAALLDAQGDGQVVENQARHVAIEL